MASSEPRSGLKFGWGAGFNGWDADMDANLQLIGRFGFHLSVKSRTLTAAPGTAISGDSYIVGAAATGAWAGKDGQVAIYDGTTWQFGVPRLGWLAYIEAESVLSVFKNNAWSTGVAI